MPSSETYFKKGNKGRRPGSKNKVDFELTKALRSAFESLEDRDKLLDELWNKATRLALEDGDFSAIRLLWERSYGRPREISEHTGEVNVKIEYSNGDGT